MQIRYSEELWPVVQLTLEGEVHDDDVDVLCRTVERPWIRKKRYVIIVDVSKMGLPTSVQRARYASHLAQSTPTYKRFNIAMVVVCSSTLVRGALTAINWICPWATTTKFKSTFDKAYAAALELYENDVHADRTTNCA